MPTQSAASSSAPMLSSDETPRDPSEFMTTALQLPSSGSHSSVCSPDPLADAAQKSSSPGGEVGASPGRCGIGVLPDVGDDGTLDALQVLGDVGVPGDAHENVAVALAADTDVAEDRPRSAFRAAEVHVGAIGDDGVGRCGEILARRHQEAVVVALDLIDHDQGRSTGEHRQREQRRDDARDDEGDPAGSTSRARRRLCRSGRECRRLIHSNPRRRRFRRQRRCACHIVLALVEPERWIGVRHQEDVRRDPHHPPVEAEHEVEEPAGIPRRKQERDSCEQHENPDQPAAVPPVPPAVILSLTGRGAGATDEDPDQDVLGDCEQPPLHEHEPSREPLRVRDGECRRVVGLLVECERRVPVGTQRPVRVVRDAPGPAQHAEVEVEDASRVATGEQDREEGDDREHGEGDPEEEQHDEVRNREQPLHQPEPAAQLRIEAAFESKREGRAVFHRRSFRSLR